MGISERIKEERERLGLNQTVFAEKICSTKRSVINWEGGSTSPSAEILAEIAAIGGDVIYILTGSRSQEALDFRPIKQAALHAHKAATAMGKVSDKQFLGIFSAMLDGAVDLSEPTEEDKPADSQVSKSAPAQGITQTANASGVMIGGYNTGTVINESKGRKRK